MVRWPRAAAWCRQVSPLGEQGLAVDSIQSSGPSCLLRGHQKGQEVWGPGVGRGVAQRATDMARKGFMGSDRIHTEGLDEAWVVSRVTGVLPCPDTHFSSTASRISVGAGEGQGYSP